jgi:hypothetical protein
LIFILIGLPADLSPQNGDGRFFVFFWAFMWFSAPLRFGRKIYASFTVAQPLVLIVSAIVLLLCRKMARGKLFKENIKVQNYLSWSLLRL